MEDDSTLCVGLDVRKASVMIAYAKGMREVELFGKIGTMQTAVDCLCNRLQAKTKRIRVVYEAGPSGYGLYRQLTAHRLDAWCARRHSSSPSLPNEPTICETDSTRCACARPSSGAPDIPPAA